MCILFINVDPNPEKGGFRLIVATNRDEYYKRPAMSALIDKNGIIGGKDMEPGREGGTWLSLGSKDQENGKGKVHCLAVLLNVTGAKVDNASGRGNIITDYLMSKKNFLEYTEMLDQTLYNGYNFVTVELSKEDQTIYHHSNFPRVNSSYLGKQTLGFGNSPIFTPLAKVTKGRQMFEDILKKNLSVEELEKELLKLLKNETRHLPDDELERRQPLAFESLSSIFIQLEPAGYGTRTHTIILIDYDWNLSFIEYTMEEPIDIHNLKWKETRLNLKL
ncbi:transport and Golgi organization protein 2-like [Diabrotica undecimpunctata]|uniref:transport and Golgi organization protein 2-like n=1 Tax=Diabrotica undecimpunctata TaxID=50387 RepID=UPI003B63AD9A